MNTELYEFNQFNADSLVHLISQHGKDLIGLELGIFKAESLLGLLQNCSNIKTLYGVDSWQPYENYLKNPYDGSPAYVVDQKTIEKLKFKAYHNIKYSGVKDKVIILEKDSNLALDDIPDSYLDFIFIDTITNYNQAQNDIKKWYNKVKPGGLFTGYNWDSPQVKKPIFDFREKNNIISSLCGHNNIFVWKK